MKLIFILCACLAAISEGFLARSSSAIACSSRWTRASSFLQMSDAEVQHQVFIGNMPFELSEEQLSSLVSERLGSSFKSIKIAKDRASGKSRGFGYVDFDAKESAEAAVSKLVGLSMNGRDFKVDLSLPRGERPARTNSGAQESGASGGAVRRSPVTPSENSVFIGNLDFSVGEEEVMAMCNDILGGGLATRVRIASDRATGKPRGFGHIDFASPDGAQKAIEMLNGIQLAGRDIRVDAAQRKEDRASPAMGARDRSAAPRQARGGLAQHSIFLGNLAWDVSNELVEDMINDILGPGLYTQVRLAVDRETGKMRGFGHVDFKDAASAERAVIELNGMQVMGRQIRADHAQKKEEGGGSSFGGGRGGGGGDRYANGEENGSFGSW